MTPSDSECQQAQKIHNKVLDTVVYWWLFYALKILFSLSIAIVEETEEDKANKRLRTLESLFPDTDPEFLHQKAVEIGDNEEEMNRWIGEAIENKSAKEFPSRSDYEERRKNAEMQEKYSGQVTVQEILDMYDDPDAYFMDEKVS